MAACCSWKRMCKSISGGHAPAIVAHWHPDSVVWLQVRDFAVAGRVQLLQGEADPSRLCLTATPHCLRCCTCPSPFLHLPLACAHCPRRLPPHSLLSATARQGQGRGGFAAAPAGSAAAPSQASNALTEPMTRRELLEAAEWLAAYAGPMGLAVRDAHYRTLMRVGRAAGRHSASGVPSLR